jgi:putative cell wall-binding protein
VSPFPRIATIVLAVLVAVGSVILGAPSRASAVPPSTPSNVAIWGTMTPEDPALWPGGGTVEFTRTSGGNISTASATVDAAGNFQRTNLSPGTYTVTFFPPSSAIPFVTSKWTPPAGVEGGSVVLAAGDSLEVNGTWRLGGSMSGTITPVPGLALVSPTVRIATVAGSPAVTRTVSADPTTGFWQVEGLPVRQYYVYAYDSGPATVATYYPRSTLSSGATSIGVTYATLTPDINIALLNSNTIMGHVTHVAPNGDVVPLAGATVWFKDINNSWPNVKAVTDAAGLYVIGNVPAGYRYRLLFEPPSSSPDLVTQWGNGVLARDDATIHTNLGSNQLVTGKDATLARGGSVTGSVSYALSSNPSPPIPYMNSKVYLFEVDSITGALTERRSMMTAADGSFSFRGVPPADYVMRISDFLSRGVGSEYWPDARYLADAEVITVEADQANPLAPVVLTDRVMDMERVTGLNRFGTAVQATMRAFPGTNVGLPVVYLANAFSFPDALSAGPAAVHKGGALLTVAPDQIPAEILAELNRLDPEEIIVVGGPTMVSDRVIAQLKALVPSVEGTNVRRITGSNRYETSLKIVEDAFPIGTDLTSAFIANGNNFPDALAGGPAAATLGAPVLLVNGGSLDIDAKVAQFLTTRGVNDVYVLGGYNSVSAGMEMRTRLVPGVTYVSRITGNNRYETAALINERFFADFEVAFLATGTGFADALVGGAFAGQIGAPLYLTLPTCVLPYIAYQSYQQQTKGTYVLGGENMLSANVMRYEVCG